MCMVPSLSQVFNWSRTLVGDAQLDGVGPSGLVPGERHHADVLLHQLLVGRVGQVLAFDTGGDVVVDLVEDPAIELAVVGGVERQGVVDVFLAVARARST